MNISKEKAIEIGKKVLIDIDFIADDLEHPSIRLEQGEDLKYSSKTKPYWLVGFAYGAEDFGSNVAHIFIDIDAETGEVDSSLVNRSGVIKIRFDSTKNKYFRVK